MKLFKLPSTIIVRLLGSFINRLASSAILPFISLYLTTNSSRKFTGTVLMILVVVSFITNILAGYLCDRIGRKKILNFFSLLETFSIALLLFSILITSIKLFVFAYTIYTIASTFKRPALTALVQDAVSEKNKEFVYRLDYWLTNLSLTLGAMLGGLLYNRYKVLLFVLLFVTSIIVTTMYFFFIQDSNNIVSNKKFSSFTKDIFQSYRQVLKNKRYVAVIFGGALILSAELGTSSYVSVRLAHDFQPFNFLNFYFDGVRMFSLINIINTCMVVLFTFSIGKLFTKFNAKRIFICGLISYTIGYFLLMSANNFSVIVLSIVVATTGELIYSPLKSSEQIEMIPSDQRGDYASFASFGYLFADATAKFLLILSSFVPSYGVSIFMLFVLILGSALLTQSLFPKKKNYSTNTKQSEKSLI